MIDWLSPATAHLKALHISMLVLWCAGLFALPLMLSRHDRAISQSDYGRVRRATHYGYIFVITPAAVLAIASGALLVFLREAFVPWMFAKLIFVALLVVSHAWVGHTISAVAEQPQAHEPPRPLVPTLLLSLPILAILALVLAKPDPGEIPFPDWLVAPRDVQLPFDVPRR
ncbi:CopD family protein [Jannaschia formosa]|uniref:CopD family protein n=1 Tax=Jannaschia formosa TaxID=2259592 RepID=UPI000E1BAC74|nr:CopD family protein [Jannaschia formosa]TFL18356.1 hypothetical protein DR046_09675 [Jannaschia formosa]